MDGDQPIMKRYAIICCLLLASGLHRVNAQSLTAKSILLSGAAWNGTVGSMIGTREIRPLVFVNASPIPQPIQFYSGAEGSDRIVDISAFGEMWVKRSLSIGQGVAASSFERERIGAIVGDGGRGLVIDMSSTSSATGLLIDDIGVNGSEHAGIVLSASTNGTGTGIRIGGPQTSDRSTLSTGIDITGGTGVRYNALNLGSGTGVEIGGTQQPQLGLECTVAGANSIGVIARANTSGMGVVGISKSAAYIDPVLLPRVGVHGYSANNSNASADSVIGVLGTGLHGGVGGTLTRSFGVYGTANSSATNHSGLMVGVFGQASATAPGTSIGVAGMFRADPAMQHISLFAFGADVYLGGTEFNRPSAIMHAPPELRVDNRTTTWLFNANASGNVSLRGTLDIKSVMNVPVPPGRGTVLIPPSCIVVLDDGMVANVTGLVGATQGRVVYMVVRTGGLLLINNDAATPPDQRFVLPGGVDILVRENGSAMLWYDNISLRWRLLGIAQ